MWACTAYALRRYRGRAVMFWARDEQKEPMSGRTTKWKEIMADLDVYSTPGTHFSSITTEAETLAKRLGAWLDDHEARMKSTTRDNV